MILREACVLTVMGLVIGVPIALGASRLIASFLFNTQPNDPRATAVALITLVVASLAASYGPARRATQIDPTTALRGDS